MASYNLPNTKAGGSITVDAGSLQEAQQKAASATGVSLAQQVGGGTFGANTTSGGSSGGSSGGGGVSSGNSFTGTNAIGQQIAGNQEFNLADLQEKKRQFDVGLDWTKQMWKNQGLPQLEIDQRAQALKEQQYLSDLALAYGNLQISQGNLALGQGAQGLDYLKTAASLGGPSDYFQSMAFNRGASQQGAPAFLQQLQNNMSAPVWSAPGGTPPTVQSMGTLGAAMGGAGGAGAGVNDPSVPGGPADQALQAIRNIYQKGGSSLAPQSLEGMGQTGMALFGSGVKAIGGDLPDFLQQYKQSRIGQTAA